MANYQVAIVRRPEGWTPDCLDDVPPEPGGSIEVLDESEDLFAVVSQAIEHNQKSLAADDTRWAVVVEPGCVGRTGLGGRLCTPVSYKVTSIWWPDTWEPNSPLDVPNCVWQSDSAGSEQQMPRDKAIATVRSLNRQCMDRPGVNWYVVVAVENESVSRTVSYEPGGVETTVEIRRLHVIVPEKGGGGDCSYCPAHDFPCAKKDESGRTQTLTTTRTGSFGIDSSSDRAN